MSVDLELFDMPVLVDLLLDPNRDRWRKRCYIIPDYIPPHAKENTRPKCVVVYEGPITNNSCKFLRHSMGPHQGHAWDIYGDDYRSPELALIALSQAPPPIGATNL